jgi:hypothetical protein
MTDETDPHIIPMSEVPLGYEPIAEYHAEEAEALAHWRKELLSDRSVLLVREGRWLSLWAVRNHIWLS